MFYLHVCMHTACMSGAFGGQKAALELELWTAVSTTLLLELNLGPLLESKYLDCQAIPPAPHKLLCSSS